MRRPGLLLIAAFCLSLITLTRAQDRFADSALFAPPIPDSSVAASRTPHPPQQIVAADLDNDAGDAIKLSWQLSPDDRMGGQVKEYVVLRGTSSSGPFDELGRATRGESTFVDNQATLGTAFYYKIIAANYDKSNGKYLWLVMSQSEIVGPAQSQAQWFNSSRTGILIGILLICGAIIYYIMAARAGKLFYVRKIAGIEEVENAVGRATEMGKSIYYIPGTQDMDQVQTLASLSILGRVAQMGAENNTRIEVPVARSLVMVTARDVVKEAYGRAGRPDAFQENQVRYITDDQFGYAAALDGLFLRERPGAIFLIGLFYAESLILAETGNSIGAIQIAGTAEPSQLPFFVAACDYTLIGEELFAASAYLSREPKLLGSLKGQDFGKALFLLAIVIGIILESLGIHVAKFFNG
jgi:hypothetical protein